MLMGGAATFCISPMLAREYSGERYHFSFWTVVAACCIYPTCILAFTRKNMGRKNGDWHILFFVLLANYALFWLATTH
jgi:hypothetical protein